MTTIDGKQVKLEEVYLYSIVDLSGKKAIALLTKDTILNPSSRNYVEYSVANISELNANMMQIKKTTELKTKVKVLYENGETLEFNPQRKELINSIENAQKEIKRVSVIDSFDVVEKATIEDFDTLSEEGKEQRKDSVNKAKRKHLVKALTAVTVSLGLLGAGSCIGKQIADSNKEDKSNNNDLSNHEQTMSTEELAKLQATNTPNVTFTPAPTATPINVARRNDATYLFDINNPDVINQKGLELYNETQSKNMLLLTSREIVDWDETLSIEVVEYINGIYPATMKNMDIPSSKAEMEKIEQAILLIDAGSQNNVNTFGSQTVNLSDYVANSNERAILNDAFILARRVSDAAVGNPVNGKIINDSLEFNKLDDDYLDAVDALLHYALNLEDEAVYRDAAASTRWTIISTIQDGFSIVPRWSSIERISEKEQVDAEYPYVWYIDNVKDTEWHVIAPKNRTRLDLLGQEKYEEINVENGKKTGSIKSYSQMEEYYKENANIVKLGIEQRIDDERLEAEKDFMDIISMTAKSNTK